MMLERQHLRFLLKSEKMKGDMYAIETEFKPESYTFNPHTLQPSEGAVGSVLALKGGRWRWVSRGGRAEGSTGAKAQIAWESQGLARSGIPEVEPRLAFFFFFL